MKTQKAVIEGILHFEPSAHHPAGGKFQIFECDMSEYDWLPIQKARMEFDVPAFDPRELLIAKLQQDRQRIIDEATKRAGAIEEKIQQLLALPQIDTGEKE